MGSCVITTDSIGMSKWFLLDDLGNLINESFMGFTTQQAAYDDAMLVQSTFASVNIPVPPPPRTFRDKMFAPTSYINTPLPDNAALDPNSDAVVAEIYEFLYTVPKVGKPFYKAPWLSISNFSAHIYVCDQNTPRMRVRYTKPAAGSAKPFHDICDAGVPIPSDVKLPDPLVDTDSPMVFWDPDHLDPAGNPNPQLWEFWHFFANSDPVTLAQGVLYECGYGGRMSGVDQNPGHWVTRYPSWPGYPNRPVDPVVADRLENKAWGACATSLPLMGLTLTLDDVVNGSIEHAIGCAVSKSAKASWWWPAQRCDGSQFVLNRQGMRLRFPEALLMPTGLHPLAQLLFKAIQKYGMVIVDRTSSSTGISFRAEPELAQFIGATPPYQLLKGLPIDKLQLLEQGSDATPNL